MPDEAGEVVFPKGLPVQMLSGEEKEEPKRRPSLATAYNSSAHSAEDHLTSDTREIEQPARNARVPEGGQNLLES